VVPENSFEFRINKFRQSLNEANSSGWNVKASHLTFGIRPRILAGLAGVCEGNLGICFA
jgi:hypothetical protein